MKNQYKAPTVHVIAVKQKTPMLAGSVNGTISDESTDKAYSKDGSFWLFEEEVVDSSDDDDNWDDYDYEESARTGW